jgi:selenide,water dikinase
VALDPEARTATLASGRRVSYDIASLDIGITSQMAALPGFAEHGVPAKPLGVRFAERWAEVAAGSGPLRMAVIGGGVAGAEIAMACAHRMREAGRDASIALIDRGRVLAQVAPGTAPSDCGAADLGVVTSWRGTRPVRGAARRRDAGGWAARGSDLTIGAAGATPQGWLADTGLDLHEGYVVVDRSLRSSSHPTLYAAGDCAHFAPDPRPKAGVYAVRAAPVLAHNLAADLTWARSAARSGRRRISSSSSRWAESRPWPRIPAGALAVPAIWRLKNRIDARFMEKLRDLPACRCRPPRATPHRAWRGDGRACALRRLWRQAGLGRPVGGDRGHRRERRATIPSVCRATMRAVIRLGAARQVISTDHLRAFALDPRWWRGWRRSMRWAMSGPWGRHAAIGGGDGDPAADGGAASGRVAR